MKDAATTKRGQKKSSGQKLGTNTGRLRSNRDIRGPFNGHLGFGKKPVVLVVDFMRAYTTRGEPFYGAMFVFAVSETVGLLAEARKRGVSVIFTRVEYSENAADGGLFVEKIPSLRRLVKGSISGEIVPELKPKPGEVVIIKQYASSFFGTALAPMLVSQGVDTVILTGCSTSGCIRATAIDGLQHGFRVMIPRECVGDRRKESHEVNLFDIDSKYGDVVGKNDVLDYFRSLPRLGPGGHVNGIKT